MDTAQRRALGVVAVAAWLLIDAVRTAGPLLLDLGEPRMTPALIAVVATAVGGAVLAWIAAEAGRHFGHGPTVGFVLIVVAVFRLALPVLSGTWLIGVGLYLAALALAGVVLASRVALGNGGGAAAVAGTSLGAAAALAEQGLLRTWDAPWRGDEWGWNALALLAALAVVNAVRGRHLDAAPSSRGWWALGLYWSTLLYAFANVAWVNTQADVRMSGGLALALAGTLVGAHLASQSRAMTEGVRVVLLCLGVVAAAAAFLTMGTEAAIAVPVAAATGALGAALVIRPGEVSSLGRLGASFVFIAAIVGPLVLVTIDRSVDLPVPAAIVPFVGLSAVMIRAAMRAGTAPVERALRGVWLRLGVGALGAAAVVTWTWASYERADDMPPDTLASPVVATWNLHQGITPSAQGGPGLDAGAIAAALDGVDVAMLQEVSRGSLLGGGADMVEFLAGETGMVASSAPGLSPQVGHAILTSGPHSDADVTELPDGDGSDRAALTVTFMGTTYVTATFATNIDEAGTEAAAIVDGLAGAGPVVVGADLPGDPTTQTSSPALATFADGGLSAVATGTATQDGEVLAEVGVLVGREVTFADTAVVAAPGSDHAPLLATVNAADAVAPVDDEAPDDEVEASPTPSPSVSVSAE
ncbi:hypothetical protein [Demequina sp. NBRC 110055]|uniref:hypothetical protein n=1 Tax=Demequina sp. NBRC 110055 TaxID=1570344 RepID=UPI000A06DF9E|nr:hypothetical protein [Demequina sp. NBRC 110055]